MRDGHTLRRRAEVGGPERGYAHERKPVSVRGMLELVPHFPLYAREDL